MAFVHVTQAVPVDMAKGIVPDVLCESYGCFGHGKINLVCVYLFFSISFALDRLHNIRFSTSLFFVTHFAQLKVSWIRKKDLHILSSEAFVFTADQRISVLHQENSSEWDLAIEKATIKDTGWENGFVVNLVFNENCSLFLSSLYLNKIQRTVSW